MNKYKTFEELKEELKDDYDRFMYDMNLELVKKIDQYKNNWEELKKWIEDDLKEVYRDAGFRHKLILEVLDKMKELEEDK